MRGMESQLMIDFREGGINDLCCHEVGIDFFRPYIVKPIHRNQITEPHVRSFMGNKRGAGQNLILSGRSIEKQTRLAVQHAAWMLHTAVLKRRHCDEIKFRKGIVDLRVVF